MTRIDWALAGTGVALGIAAMAVDHLLGDDPGLEDPPTFAASAAIVVVVAAVLFGASCGGHASRASQGSSSLRSRS